MKILLVDPWGGGGITVFYANLAQFLRTHDVIVDAYCYQHEWHSVDVVKPYCRQLYRPPYSLAEIVGSGDYDAVQLSTDCVVPPFDAHLQLRRIRFSGKVVVTAHHRPGDINLPLETIDQMVAVSPSAAKALRDVVGCDAMVIRNGIDMKNFHPRAHRDGAAAQRPIIAWVGRADDFVNKDIASFLYLAASLDGSGYCFSVVDGSPETGAWLRSAQEWFTERLDYSHRLSQGALASFYRRVAASGGALIMTSQQESGCPLVLLEAWASGCPTVVPDVPGFGEALEAGASLSYRRSSARQDIYGRLEILRDPTVRGRLVAKGLELVRRRFSLDAMGSAYLDLYDHPAAGQLRSARQRAMGSLWGSAYRARRIVKGS